jgi:MHS family proline/betaine transporter-like MFS transporter
MDGHQPAPKARQMAAAVIGNVLEWYDFIVFGLLTVVISRLFFPTGSQYASLLLTTATFGVCFFMRPVGGILLGIYADRKGRKAALLLIIGLMTFAIGMIAFAPTYAAIGIAAPLIMCWPDCCKGLQLAANFPAPRRSSSRLPRLTAGASMVHGRCAASARPCSWVLYWAHW